MPIKALRRIRTEANIVPGSLVYENGVSFKIGETGLGMDNNSSHWEIVFLPSPEVTHALKVLIGSRVSFIYQKKIPDLDPVVAPIPNSVV